MPNSNRILVKLAPTVGLAAAESRANLRPLFDDIASTGSLGLAAEPAWYLADLPDGGPTQWDMAHAQVASQLGVDESAVLFAEPDLEQTIYTDPNDKNLSGKPFAMDSNCKPPDQQDSGGRVKGEGIAWHLRDEYSQLGSARDAVQFSDRRTRIAHIDTGYDKEHIARPEDERILHNLERSFVDGDNQPNNANDPNRGRAFPDNSGHGTGTSGILAGRQIPQFNNIYLGGAPHADILPLRISNSVVLFTTSAFAQAIQYATQQGCDVVSISMGGLPSRAWNEAVNKAYESGVCIVAAAGNSMGGIPTHHVVYPARYKRTIAVCGVMANHKRYYDLSIRVLEGSWGPDSCMTAAISAYTPNIPWAMFGCKDSIRLNGEGTSSATPQVAAAVALWFEKYKNSLPRNWQRVEAVRNALFTSAKDKNADPEHLGHGILQARAALDVSPVLNLPMTPAESDSFSFLRVITGLGITTTPPREVMYNLEITQRWLLNKELQEIVPNPDLSTSAKAEGGVSRDEIRKFMEAVIGDDKASLQLRKHVADRYSLVFGASVKGTPKRKIPEEVIPTPQAACNPNINIPDPPFRRIRTYAVDPSFSAQLDTAELNEVTLNVKWEKVEPGPTGEYIEVVDEDIVGQKYPPVDLNDPRLLMQDGWAPSEGNPAFHQQMVYAVAMKTIEFFEQALGRPVLWRAEINSEKEFDDSKYRQRLRIRPHALHQANAFYSPQGIELLFGYFLVPKLTPENYMPGSKVFTCLSHDIVAHETTHAILDGMQRRFMEPTNLDVLAFHEGFADIVALMQHFTVPEILENEINRTRGNLETESLLGSLAIQFGRAMGKRGALREAIGTLDDKGNWVRRKPDPTEYEEQKAPHTRGSILVAAVFDAFLAIYKTRTADLLRLYTGGTGILPAGAIHPDLVHRLSDEATISARHILNMCIRALDYIPPVDITFGEYLRGLITADFDLVKNDKYNYRVAFVEAFRKRGIYPQDVNTLSVETLRWDGIPITKPAAGYEDVVNQLKKYADACFYISDRKTLFEETRKQRIILKKGISKIFKASPDFAELLGLDPKLSFEVHELRRAMRISPDGKYVPQVVVSLTQSRRDVFNGETVFRGGSTIIVDLSKPAVQYAITKNINSPSRQQRTAAFLTEMENDPLQALMIAPDRKEPFAALHLHTDISDL